MNHRLASFILMMKNPFLANQRRPIRVVSLLLLFTLTACQSASLPQWRWERIEAGLPRQAITLAVAADPIDPSRLWLGYYAPSGLAASNDGGQTWTVDAAGLAD